MKFAKIVFWCAGIAGIIVVTPMYLMLNVVDLHMPPPINHPVFFYGLLGVVLVWHVAFCLIGADPARFRPMMVPAMLEKFVFVATVLVLYLQQRTNSDMLLVAGADFLLGLLFAAAFLKTSNRHRTAEKVLL